MAARSSTSNRDDIGKLLLRVAVGLLILLHGIAKVRHGLGDVADAMARAHLPQAVGYLVYVGEVLAPLLMILGLWTRVAALVVVANMVVALLLGHPHELFAMTTHGGLLLEVQWLMLAGALSVALLGPGRYSLRDRPPGALR
jgi:putative oxidoreductase